MKAVRKTKKEQGLELVEVDEPKPGANDVLVKIQAASMCGTDVHIYNWDSPWKDGRVKPPRTLGHEIAGEVVELGSAVTALDVGDFISAESHIADNTCHQCHIGNQHICNNMKLLGVDVDGGFADYVLIPEQNAWKNPKGMDPEIATLQESMGNSVYTTFSGPIVGQYVTVFGCGPTGLFAIGLARAAGAAKVLAVTGTQEHIDLAKKMGADRVINRHDEDVVKEILNETDGNGADVFLEMSGAESALKQGLESLRRGGRVSLLGLPSHEVKLEWSWNVVLKEAHINGVWGRKMFETWVTGSRLLHSGRLDISPVITHRYKLEEFEKGFDAMKSGKSGKVVFTP